METLEIVVLVVGGILLLLSFFLPAGKGTDMEKVRELAKEEVKELVNQELAAVRSRVDDTVEDSLQEGTDKAERALERLTNEKIMAVSEYSDTVLDEINRNHKEVMFLYDMLNEKHQNIKTTVSEVNKTVRAAGEAARERQEESIALAEVTAVQPEAEIPVELENLSQQDRNAIIRQMSQQGVDEVEIAQKLGMGVGEVKLIIGLSKNM